MAGLRAGLAGERSGLFREVVRLAGELAPEWMVLENVHGLFSSYGPISAAPESLGDDPWEVAEDSDFEAVITALTDLGRGVAWRVFDARYFGVAQRRRRVLIVSHRDSVRRAAEVLFEPESCERYPASRQEAGPGVASTLSKGSARSGGVSQPGRRREDDENLVGYALRKDAGGTGQGHNTNYVAHPLLSKGNDSHGHRGGHRTEPGEHLVALPLRSSFPDSDSEHDTYVTHSLRAEGCDASEDGTGRGTPLIAWDRAQITSAANRVNPQPGEPCPPLNESAGVMYGVRRLMPVECELLMAFPPGWTCLKDHPQQCDCPDTPRYQALGNAIVVNVAEWVLRRIAEAHHQR